MNGRIYDPGLGRFLQADPLIQDLSNPQSLNRYSYVFNNPLAYTDPSGYSAFSKYLSPILAIGAAYFTAGWSTSLYAAGNTAAALAVSIGGGALTGAIATGSGKGALIGAFTGAAAFGVGSSIAGGNSERITNDAMRNGAEMLAGGFQNLVNHGEFGFTAMMSVSAEYGADSYQTQSRERSQNLIDLNARDATPEDYASVMGAPENWFAYESIGTMAQEYAQRDYQVGKITLEQLNSIYGYQAGGAALGAVGAAGGAGIIVGGGYAVEALALRTTIHGAARIGSVATRAGSLSRLELLTTRLLGKRTLQSDGARVFYRATSGGKYKFAVYGEKGLITSGRWSTSSVRRVARRYGWKDFP